MKEIAERNIRLAKLEENFEIFKENILSSLSALAACVEQIENNKDEKKKIDNLKPYSKEAEFELIFWLIETHSDYYPKFELTKKDFYFPILGELFEILTQNKKIKVEDPLPYSWIIRERSILRELKKQIENSICPNHGEVNNG